VDLYAAQEEVDGLRRSGPAGDLVLVVERAGLGQWWIERIRERQVGQLGQRAVRRAQVAGAAATFAVRERRVDGVEADIAGIVDVGLGGRPAADRPEVAQLAFVVDVAAHLRFVVSGFAVGTGWPWSDCRQNPVPSRRAGASIEEPGDAGSVRRSGQLSDEEKAMSKKRKKTAESVAA